MFVSRTPYIQSLKRHQSESMVNRTHINSAKSIFLEYRQAIIAVATFHHVLGRGFMIQRVILIYECVILVSLSKLMNIKLSWNACIHVQLLIRKTIPVSN